MTDVALYVRVSTQEQQLEGVSLEAQEARGRSYCQLHRLSEPVLFMDGGVSGSVPLAERDAGRQLVEAVRTGRVRHVIAVKLDRLFRDAVNCLEVTHRWDKEGVALHLIDMGGQAVNTTTALGRFFLTIMAGAAEMERNLIRERTKSALQHKKQRGDRLGADPLGYRTPEPGKPMQPVDGELQAVKLILSLRRRDARRWSFREIAARLEREGHKSKRGGAWSPSTVKQVWDRRTQYAGLR